MDALRLSDAFAAAARDSLDRLREGEARVRADDLEGLHLMRTAARRLRAGVAHLGRHLPRERRSALKDGLRRLMRILGAVRDLDVLRGAVASTPLSPADADTLRTRAWRRMQRPMARMRQELDGDAYRALLASVAEAIATPAAATRATDAGPGRLWSAIRETLAGRPADWSAGEAALHELRKSVKRLRYALEAFAPAYGRPVVRMIERCRDLQEALGAIQDAATFASTLRGCRTFAAGQFLATVAARADAVRADLPRLWRRAFGPRRLARLGAHLLRRAAEAAPVEAPAVGEASVA